MKIGLEFVAVGVIGGAIGVGVTLMARSLATRDLHVRMERLEGQMAKLIWILSQEEGGEESEAEV